MYEIMKTWKLSFLPNWKSLEEYENVTAFFLSIHPNEKYENMKTYFLPNPIEGAETNQPHFQALQRTNGKFWGKKNWSTLKYDL